MSSGLRTDVFASASRGTSPSMEMLKAGGVSEVQNDIRIVSVAAA
jgi:hypothetical protein